MKLGILLCAYGNPDYVKPCIEPWLNRNNVIIAGVHGQFKEYNENGVIDNDFETADILEDLYHKNLIQHLYIQNRYDDLGTGCLNHYGSEAEIRDEGLQFLKDKCDWILLLDLDEFWTEKEIDNLFEYLNQREANLYTWYSICYKNYILDGKQWVDDFCPPRLFKTITNYNGYLCKLDKFFYDNDVYYKTGHSGGDISYKLLPNKSIPKDLIFCQHMTWLHSNGKNKYEYQMKHFGHCGYKWNYKTNLLEIDTEFYNKFNLTPPIIYED